LAAAAADVVAVAPGSRLRDQSDPPARPQQATDLVQPGSGPGPQPSHV